MADHQTVALTLHGTEELTALHASVAHYRYQLCVLPDGAPSFLEDVDRLMSWQTLAPLLNTLTVGTVELPRVHADFLYHAVRVLEEAARLTVTGHIARELSARLASGLLSAEQQAAPHS